VTTGSLVRQCHWFDRERTLRWGKYPAEVEEKGGNELRLTGLMSAERVAHIFRMIAAPRIGTDVDEVSESGGDTLGITMPKSYGHGSNSLDSILRSPLLLATSAQSRLKKSDDQNDGILMMMCYSFAYRMIARHNIKTQSM
jgi:hypothetical protein